MIIYLTKKSGADNKDTCCAGVLINRLIPFGKFGFASFEIVIIIRRSHTKFCSGLIAGAFPCQHKRCCFKIERPHRLAGPGHQSFTLVTGVQIPLGTPKLLSQRFKEIF